MYRWLIFIGLILLVILASGFTDSTYAWDGHGRSSGHGWGGHGYSGYGYRGYGWGGPRYWGPGSGFFFSPWSLLIPPLPLLPVPVPVPGPPVAPEPYPD
jgi:hypothetical protein